MNYTQKRKRLGEGDIMKNAIGAILSGTDEKVILLFPQGVGHLSSELCLQLVRAEITKKGA